MKYSVKYDDEFEHFYVQTDGKPIGIIEVSRILNMHVDKIAELEADKWISVEDRLPDSTGRVLASDCYEVSDSAYIKYKEGGGKWGRGVCGVTHWMPLPAPSKKSCPWFKEKE